MTTVPPEFSALLAQYETRRDAIDCAPGEALPEADAPLERLEHTVVSDPDHDPAYCPPFRSNFHRKQHAIRKELTGLSELCSLHGLLIAHLRKREFPEHTPYLFHRLWDEHADHLLEHLDARWLVSAVTTFGDHGLSQTQRATGLALSTLFGMMKLYETERLYSDHAPRQPYSSAKRQRPDLPLEMDAYALVGGGLDVNTLARLWQEAAQDAVIAPLAHHLLQRLLTDERALFARLAKMRREKEQHRAAKETTPQVTPKVIAPVIPANLPASAADLRWGLVSTVKAGLPQIARFAAHHLDLGAEAIHLFLDTPNHAAQTFLSRHPKLHVTVCDEAYWQASGRKRPEAHQLRQSFNATRCLHGAQDLHWLGHIDVDEFLLTDQSVAEQLYSAPISAAFARMAPIEALATDTGDPQHFKRTHSHAGVKKSELQDVYPTFGLHLYGGFLSHTSGKIFARTGIADTRLGIHTLKYRGQDAANRCKLLGLSVAHLHTPSWEVFRAHLAFRLTKGSYRKRSERPELGQWALLSFLQEEEGEDGLRAFFDEVCADTPELRERLAARRMLVTHDLDLDAKVHRHFGELP